MRFGKQESMATYLRPEQKKALVSLAKKRKVSANVLIREGIDHVLSKYKEART